MGFLAPSWVLINMAPGSTRTTDWWLGFGRTCPDLFHGRVARRLHSSPSCRCPDNRLGDLSEGKRGGYLVHSNQDLIWCAKTGGYMGFWVHRGS